MNNFQKSILKMSAEEFFSQKWIDLEKKIVLEEENKRRREKLKKQEQELMKMYEQLKIEEDALFNEELEMLIVDFEKLKIET